MNIEFEQKHYVIKVADVERYLSDDGKKALFRCLDSLSDSRRLDGKKENNYLVLNTDEPYASQVANIMQAGGSIVVSAPENEGNVTTAKFIKDLPLEILDDEINEDDKMISLSIYECLFCHWRFLGDCDRVGYGYTWQGTQTPNFCPMCGKKIVDCAD